MALARIAAYPYASDKVVSFATEIQPKEAQAMLDTSRGNRELRPKHVQYLVGLIQRGEFVLTSDAISFYADGSIANGHHRLTACVMANKPINVILTMGLPLTARDGIDQGIKRSRADVFLKDKRVVEPWTYLVSVWYGQQLPSIHQMEEFMRVLPFIEALVSTCGTTRRGVSAAPVKAAAVLQVMDRPDDAKDYVHQQYRAMCLLEYDAMSRIAQAFVRQMVQRQTTSSTNRSDVFARAMKVFNPDNADLVKIQLKDGAIAWAMEEARSILESYIK